MGGCLCPCSTAPNRSDVDKEPLSRINFPEYLLVCTELWNLALTPPSLEMKDSLRNFLIKIINPQCLPKIWNLALKPPSLEMMDLQRGPNLKNHYFGLLTQTLKSGPEAAKPWNYFPGPRTQFSVEGRGKSSFWLQGWGQCSQKTRKDRFQEKGRRKSLHTLRSQPP